jgi:hypothetical protein
MRFVCPLRVLQAIQFLQFRDILMTEVAQTGTPDGSLTVNMCVWLNKTTLDIIGDAGNDASINFCTSRGEDAKFTRL